MPKAEIRDRVRDALALVELADYASRYPTELSGGQQQRVALARAIVFRPGLLLMDEPLSALDRGLRKSMQSEIRRIHRNLKTTIIYVTHDQDEALSMSDRIVLMHDGEIVQVGTPTELYDSPVNTFVANFVGESTLLRGVVDASVDGGYRVKLDSGELVACDSGRSFERGDAVVIRIRPGQLSFGSAELGAQAPRGNRGSGRGLGLSRRPLAAHRADRGGRLGDVPREHEPGQPGSGGPEGAAELAAFRRDPAPGVMAGADEEGRYPACCSS
ncbi:ABC transporter ATP-binding protein [Leucobacter soli]